MLSTERMCYGKPKSRWKPGDSLRFSDRSPLWEDLKYTLWLPLYLLLFLALERMPMDSYWATQLPVDARIPFCEWFVIPYCLWYPLLAGTGVWLWLRRPAAFRRYMAFLAASFLLSALIWVLFPSIQNLRPAVLPQNSPLAALVAGLYRLDTPTNVFPSVHVVGSAGAALAVWDGAGARSPLTWAAGILAALICLSTVFIKQHALADVAGGMALSLLVAVPIYSRRSGKEAKASRHRGRETA